jgi:hypothetical protein
MAGSSACYPDGVNFYGTAAGNPFAYLNKLSTKVRNTGAFSRAKGERQTKTSSKTAAGFVRTECSLTVLSCGEDKSLSERSTGEKPSDFLKQIAFPQRKSLIRFTNSDRN